MSETKAPGEAKKPEATASAPAPEAKAEAKAPAKDQEYFLKPGKEHTIIIQGENKTITDPNEPIVLSPEAYEAFKDKFDTKAEHTGRLAQIEAEVKAAKTE